MKRYKMFILIGLLVISYLGILFYIIEMKRDLDRKNKLIISLFEEQTLKNQFIKKYYNKILVKDDIQKTYILSKIYDISIKFGQDPDFIIKMVKKESSFNPKATSPAGAKGLLQLMPETAKMVARLLGKEQYDLFDIEDNLTLGVYFYSLLLKWNKGDTLLALAKYNAGNRWYLGLDYARDIMTMEM